MGIRRNVMILSEPEIGTAFNTARIRTISVLDISHHLVSAPPFGHLNLLKLNNSGSEAASLGEGFLMQHRLLIYQDESPSE